MTRLFNGPQVWRRKGTWSPRIVTSESGGAWHKSSTGLYDAVSGGSAVTTTGSIWKRWEDVSGNGLHITQTGADSTCLKLNTSSIGGKPCVVGDWFPGRYALFNSSLSVNRRNCSIFVIARPFQLGVQTFFNAGPSVAGGIGLDCDLGNLRSYFVTGPSVNNHTTLVPSCNPLLFGLSGDSGDCTAYLADASATGTVIDSGTVTGGALGAQIGGSVTGACEFYEVIIVPRKMTAAEVASLRGYTAANYGPQTFTKRLVIEGDSLTDGAYALYGQTWPLQLGNSIGTSWQVYNYGIAGATVANMNTERAAQIESLLGGSHTTKQTAMFGGTNDLNNGDSAATVETRLASWHAGVRAAGSQKSYVYTIPARGDAGWDAGKESARTTLNTSIRANYNGASYGGSGNALVDLAADARFQTPSDTTYYHTDLIHFTNGGFAAIASLTQAQM